MATDDRRTADEAVRLDAISRRVSGGFALREISLCVRRGEILALIGHTGAGKSSLLRVIAGLDREDSGEVAVFGKPMNKVEPHQRSLSFLFQRDVFYPGRRLASDWTEAQRAGVFDRWRQAGVDPQEVREELQLGEAAFDQPPETLSGGQGRRASLLRALLRDMPILLADEPLTGLDLWTRDRVSRLLWRFVKATGKTMIVVAHEPAESFALADRLAVLHEGRLVQEGSAENVCDAPAHRVVVSLLHFPPWNELQADFEPPCDGDAASGRTTELAPPQSCRAVSMPKTDQPNIPVRFLRKRRTTCGTFVEWQAETSSRVYRSPDLVEIPEPAFLIWDPGQVIRFDAKSGVRLA